MFILASTHCMGHFWAPSLLNPVTGLGDGARPLGAPSRSNRTAWELRDFIIATPFYDGFDPDTATENRLYVRSAAGCYYHKLQNLSQTPLYNSPNVY